MKLRRRTCSRSIVSEICWSCSVIRSMVSACFIYSCRRMRAPNILGKVSKFQSLTYELAMDSDLVGCLILAWRQVWRVHFLSDRARG